MIVLLGDRGQDLLSSAIVLRFTGRQRNKVVLKQVRLEVNSLRQRIVVSIFVGSVTS